MNNDTSTIPVFPLRGALLLPSGNLPLNIFEPRYIAMVNYALKNNKLIGMIQPRSDDSNELFKIGCMGKITTYSETEDNRFLINLRGISKFQIINEVKHNEKFKLFEIKEDKQKLIFEKFESSSFNKIEFLQKIKSFFDKKGLSANFKSLDEIDDKSLIIMIGMICPFSANEKQALLESRDIGVLANTIISLLDFEINQTRNYETIN